MKEYRFGIEDGPIEREPLLTRMAGFDQIDNFFSSHIGIPLLFVFVIQEIANDHDDHEERHLDLGVEIHDKTISKKWAVLLNDQSRKLKEWLA